MKGKAISRLVISQRNIFRAVESSTLIKYFFFGIPNVTKYKHFYYFEDLGIFLR